MRIVYKDIIDKHRDVPCVIACHGPSLDAHKDKIQALQKSAVLCVYLLMNGIVFFREA